MSFFLHPLTIGALALGLALGAGNAGAAACQGGVAIPPRAAAARLVIFGELHGTKEAPGFVGQYLCSLLQQKEKKLVLGLEIPADSQGAIDAYLASAGDAASRRALLGQGHWQTDTPDGRSSVAMFELIELVRGLRAEGKPVAILAFDAWPQDRPRDAAMGENIRASMQAAPDASHVVLAGNVHARNAKGMRGEPDYEPMAFTLRDLQPLSLNIDFSSGKAWVCMGRRDCGERSMAALPAPLPKTVGLSLSKPLLFAGFDGEYFVGALSASPPAAAALGVPSP